MQPTPGDHADAEMSNRDADSTADEHGESSADADRFRGPPSAEEARQWRKAALDGNVDAMCNLGRLCYEDGQLTGSDSA